MKHPKSYDTTPEISRRMSHVHLKKGKAETLLAKALWRKGLRYKRNDKSLPGSPDIAVKKYHIAIFIDGEFWHGQNWDERKKKLKRNREYWIEKIEENIARDIRNDKALQAQDWVPVHFWEKEVLKNLDSCIASIEEIVEVQRELLIDGKEIALYDQGDDKIVEY